MTRMPPGGEPLETWGADDTPDGFVWQNVHHEVLDVVNRWRVHTLWWEPNSVVWREYLKVVTDGGILCQIYRDMVNGGWFLARVYD